MHLKKNKLTLTRQRNKYAKLREMTWFDCGVTYTNSHWVIEIVTTSIRSLLGGNVFSRVCQSVCFGWGSHVTTKDLPIFVHWRIPRSTSGPFPSAPGWTCSNLFTWEPNPGPIGKRADGLRLKCLLLYNVNVLLLNSLLDTQSKTVSNIFQGNWSSMRTCSYRIVIKCK